MFLSLCVRLSKASPSMHCAVCMSSIACLPCQTCVLATGPFTEPPSDDVTVARAAQRLTPDHIDEEVLCRALQALCDLVANDADKQRWLHSAGVLPLAQRLLQRGGGGGLQGGQRPEGCTAVQSARALAMLSAEPSVAVRDVVLGCVWHDDLCFGIVLLYRV